MPLATKHHHSQLPAMPPVATIPVTASGVSAAKVVATIERPGQPPGNIAAGEEEFVDARSGAGLVIKSDSQVEEEVERDTVQSGSELH